VTTSATRGQPWLLPLAALAAASIGAAAWLAVLPGRSGDLAIVLSWLRHMAETGVSPYVVADLEVDYPPHALVLLYPLVWLPEGREAIWFVGPSVLCAIWMAWTWPRWMAEHLVISPLRHSVTSPFRHFVTSPLSVWFLLVLTWGPVRVGIWNAQTVAPAIIAALAAVTMARRVPWVAGVLFALAATKPPLAVALGVFFLLRGDTRVIAVGVVVALGMATVFDGMMGQVPFSWLPQYVQSLEWMYTGTNYFRGVTTFQPVFDDTIADPVVAHTLFRVIALALGVWGVWRMWAARRLADAQVLVATACFLWVLVALPNQRYYLVLLFPVAWMAWHTPARLLLSETMGRTLVAVIVIFNTLDTPLLVRQLAVSIPTSEGQSLAWLWWLAYVVAAPLVLVCYVIVVRAASGWAQSPGARASETAT
jgi:hypothetical protein